MKFPKENDSLAHLRVKKCTQGKRPLLCGVEKNNNWQTKGVTCKFFADKTRDRAQLFQEKPENQRVAIFSRKGGEDFEGVQLQVKFPASPRHQVVQSNQLPQHKREKK